MAVLATAYSDAPNLAPSKPLEQLAYDQANDQSVYIDEDWFKDCRKELEEENGSVWKDSVLLWEMIFLFIEGKQILRRSKYGTGWRAVPLPDRTDSPVYSLNLVGFYSDNIKAKWTQSSTDVKWRPVSDADQAVGASKAASNVQQFYERKLYTETFKQGEATLAQCGKYARYYYYSKDVKSYARRPKVEPQQVQFGEPSYFCAECGGSGPVGLGGAGSEAAAGPVGRPFEPDASGAEMVAAPQLGLEPGAQGGLNGQPNAGYISAGDSQGMGAGVPPGLPADGVAPPPTKCPDCGSPNIDVEQPEPLQVEAVTGYESIEHGSICCESVPAFELKHDIQFQPHESPYLVRTRRIRLSILQSKFPEIKFKASKGDYAGLDAADDLKRSTFASSGQARGSGKSPNAEPTADFIQIWLDPAMYDRCVIKKDYQTVSGMRIPAGTKLIDAFKDGLYLCWIQGVDGVVEMRNEHHKQFWVGQVYRMRALSSLGSGTEDMLEGNRQYNLTMSLIYTLLRTAATPATLYDETLLPNGVSAYLANPLKNIPVNTTGLENKRLQDAVHQLQPQPPSQAHFSYSQQLDFFCQKASRVTDFSGGLPGVNNETATGAQIASANSQSLFAPQLALKAEADRRGAEIILELFRVYCIDEIYVSLAGKRGKQDGVWLSAADIAVELFAEVVPESYLPQTNLERRQRFKELLLDVGGLIGLKMAMQEMPGLVEQITETYDVDLGAEDYTAAAETARQRIDQMAQAAPLLQMAMAGMPPTQMAADPMTGQMMEVPVDPMAEAGQMLLGILQPPIEIEELGHLAAINVYRDWLTTDEGKEAPPEQRAGVKAAIYRHVEGLIAEAQLTGMVSMAGQPMPGAGEEQGGPPNDKKNKNPDQKQMGGRQPQQKQQTMGAGV